MKRNLLYLFICVNFMLGLTACYEDKSTPADHVIPEIVIDTTGIKETFTLKQFERLQITPSVSKADTDPSDLSYKWMMSLKPVSFSTTALHEDRYICIGEEMTLDAEITVEDAVEPYRLWYQVTDNTTGLRKDIVWEVNVQAPYGEGLLIVESKDGGNTADLALLQSEQFTKGHEGEPAVSSNIYSKANNGATINADVFQLSAFRMARSDKYFALLGKGEDQYLLLNKKYKLQYRNEEGFVEGAIEKVDPTFMGVFSGQYFVLVNDGKIHTMYCSGGQLAGDGLHVRWGIPAQYQKKAVTVDKMLAMGFNNYPSTHYYYDKEAGAVKAVLHVIINSNAYLYDVPTKAGWDFNPKACPNWETVFSGYAPGKCACLLMKEKTSGEYGIFVGANFSAMQAFIKIPECELDNAIGYAVNEQGNVLYFATAHDIYAIQLDLTPAQVVKIHSFEDEITHFSFFRQAWETTDYASSTLSTCKKILLAATWNGTEGKLTTLPILNFATGEIDKANIVEYGGFGKIMTLTHQYP